MVGRGGLSRRDEKEGRDCEIGTDGQTDTQIWRDRLAGSRAHNRDRRESFSVYLHA